LRTELATGPRPGVFRGSDKPNDLILLAEHEDAARAPRLIRSTEFREATQRTGVTAPPEVTMASHQASRKRHGIIREAVWIQRTPGGDDVVVYMEVKDLEAAFKGVATSEEPFDR
jgi:hypothetical protein